MMTVVGSLSPIAKLSRNSMSVEISAVPITRSVTSTPGTKNNSAIRGSTTRLCNVSVPVVPAAIGEQQRALVDDADESGRVAPR